MTTPITFNDLLLRANIDTLDVLALRHRPKEPELRKMLPWMAAEKPALYNAYQQCQTPSVEKAMGKAGHVASFIGHEPGKALFIGLYEVAGQKTLTLKEYWSTPRFQRLTELGMQGPAVVVKGTVPVFLAVPFFWATSRF